MFFAWLKRCRDTETWSGQYVHCRFEPSRLNLSTPRRVSGWPAQPQKLFPAVRSSSVVMPL